MSKQCCNSICKSTQSVVRVNVVRVSSVVIVSESKQSVVRVSECKSKQSVVRVRECKSKQSVVRVNECSP